MRQSQAVREELVQAILAVDHPDVGPRVQSDALCRKVGAIVADGCNRPAPIEAFLRRIALWPLAVFILVIALSFPFLLPLITIYSLVITFALALLLLLVLSPLPLFGFSAFGICPSFSACALLIL